MDVLSPSEGHDGAVVNDIVLSLQRIWRTEVHCPQILKYQEEIVDELKSKVSEQQVCFYFVSPSMPTDPLPFRKLFGT